MDSSDPPADPRSTPELFATAKSALDEEARWAPIHALRIRGTDDVLLAALALCDSMDPSDRALGVDVLAQFGAGAAPVPAICAPTYERLLLAERDARVLASLAHAVGCLEKSAPLERVFSLVGHHDARVRFGVAGAALGREDERAIRLLITLSADPDDDVRDWATFGLGSQVELDTQDIRDALAARLDDLHDATREEAILGLATRRDPRAFDPLRRALSGDTVAVLAIDAAKALGDVRLLPALREIQAWWRETDGALEGAIAACSPPDDAAR